jgi:hypothetical protein
MAETKKTEEGRREDRKVAKREEGVRDGQREANMARHGQAMLSLGPHFQPRGKL